MLLRSHMPHSMRRSPIAAILLAAGLAIGTFVPSAFAQRCDGNACKGRNCTDADHARCASRQSGSDARAYARDTERGDTRAAKRDLQNLKEDGKALRGDCQRIKRAGGRLPAECQ